MLPLINEIITLFGPRVAGSEAEYKAQNFVADKCRQYTPHVRVLEFKDYLNARFGKLKYYVVIYFLSLAIIKISPPIALLLTATSMFFIVFDLTMYRDILTNFPGKLQTSSNVEATLEPSGEVQSTLIFSGHMDSTLEYRWWFKYGETGVKMTVACGILMALQMLYNLSVTIHPYAAAEYLWWFFLLASPLTIVWWSMYAEEAVPGAQDNLSGIAIAFETFRHFSHESRNGISVLKNTRVKFISFGSEEKGLCGSRAYARQNEMTLKKENAHLINIDGVRLVSELAVVNKETMNGASHSPILIKKLNESFVKVHAAPKNVAVPIGGTDAVSFTRRGIPAVTIIGMSATNYDFTYHTRNDIVDHIEPQSLEIVKNALIDFVEKWDKSR
ncbi:MAG: M28 family peptidase [Bacteroidetes bacterium]|nr:M28 family peptidase [Bacteroidota bacterium]